MSEYVVTINAESYMLRGTFDVELREQIVRCRDCANYDPREGFGCAILGRWNDATSGFASCDMGAHGFCAWGVRGES